jgi:uncharacterized protein
VASDSGARDLIEVFVGDLILDPNTKAPVLILRNIAGDINIPIWIGIPEATGIASAKQQISLSRPLTHDLMYKILDVIGVAVKHVEITDLRDATYIAQLVMILDERVMTIDCRPSDAINLALRANVPIYIASAVVKSAQALGEPQPIDNSQTDEANSVFAEENFPSDDFSSSEFNNDFDFNQIDKDKWEEILNNLDPDDFKYRT